MSTDQKELWEQMDRSLVEIAAATVDAVVEHLALDLTPEQYREVLLAAARRQATVSRVAPRYPRAFEEAVEAFLREREEERKRAGAV